MTNKQVQAIKTLYKDGIQYKEVIDKSGLKTEEKRYFLNGKMYYSNSVGMFNEKGSFICNGYYAVLIQNRETYDKFIEIKEADTKHYKINFNIDGIYKLLMQRWNNYLSGKCFQEIYEGDLPKDWKQNVVHKQEKIVQEINCHHKFSKNNFDVYMINDAMLNKVYLDHVTKFMKSDIHWIIIGDRLQPVFLTDGNVVAVIMPIRYNN